MRGPVGPPVDVNKLDETVLKSLRGKRGKRGKRGPPGPPGPPAQPPALTDKSAEKNDAGTNNPFAELKSLTTTTKTTTTTGTASGGLKLLKVASIEALTQDWSQVPTGTIAFLEQEEEVLIRIMAGWQHIQVKNIPFTSRFCTFILQYCKYF